MASLERHHDFENHFNYYHITIKKSRSYLENFFLVKQQGNQLFLLYKLFEWSIYEGKSQGTMHFI